MYLVLFSKSTKYFTILFQQFSSGKSWSSPQQIIFLNSIWDSFLNYLSVSWQMVQIVTPGMWCQTPERQRWHRKCGANLTVNVNCKTSRNLTHLDTIGHKSTYKATHTFCVCFSFSLLLSSGLSALGILGVRLVDDFKGKPSHWLLGVNSVWGELVWAKCKLVPMSYGDARQI
jgi:hypothetical protein